MEKCCKDEKNLELYEQRDSGAVYKCRECGRKHYVMEADAGHLGVTGKGM